MPDYRIVYSSALLLLQIVTVAPVDPVVQCTVNVADVYLEKSPVLMTRKFEFVYPLVRSFRSLDFEWFEDRLVYCPGGQLSLRGQPLPDVPAQPVTLPQVVRCVQGVSFALQFANRPALNLGELQCSEKPATSDWDETSNLGQPIPCSRGRGRIVMLGFVFDRASNSRKPVIKACYVEDLGTTTWSYHILTPSIRGHPVFQSKFTFVSGSNFRGISIGEYYKGCNEEATIQRYFEEFVFVDNNGNPVDKNTLDPVTLEAYQNRLKEISRRYIRYSNATYKETDLQSLVKGHLTPKADLFHFVEQRSSYYYANALPMWHTINSGNWGGMESYVRETAARLNCYTEIWTGGLQLLQLHARKDLYLGFKVNRAMADPVTYAVPVPKILYKVVYCHVENKAMVFLAANNPYVTNVDYHDYVICQEYVPCRALKPQWFDFSTRGFVYCCEYRNFIASPLVQDIELPTVGHIDDNVQPLFP